MKINPITQNSTDFNGKVIVKNKISVNQNYLFNLHKGSLDAMIKDMPFDLFVEQSKSKKTISLATNVEGAYAYIVKKNKQNFEEAAGYAIEDGKRKSKIYQSMIRINKMLEYSQNAFANIITGNFKNAREYEKKLAEIAINNFEDYKKIPRFKYFNMPWAIQKMALPNIIKYRFYKAFSSKTPDEQTFIKMKKNYVKELKKENKKIPTINITFPNLY